MRLGIAGSPTSTANANFTFGGGSIGGLTASLDARGLNPVSGSYAFGSTVFTGPQLFAATNVIFVGSAATGAGDGSSVNDLATIDTADANTEADAVFVLVNDGSAINDADGFTLGSGQTFASFGNGAQYALGGLPLNVTGINVQNGVVQSDPTGNGAATLTSGAAAGTITLGDGTFLADINLAGTGAGNVVNLGNNTSLDGVGVSGGSVGIFGNDISGVTLTNVSCQRRQLAWRVLHRYRRPTSVRRISPRAATAAPACRSRAAGFSISTARHCFPATPSMA